MKRDWEKPMTSWRSRIVALAVLAGSVLPAFAQNAIQSINSSQQAGSEVIRIEMTEPLAAIPAGEDSGALFRKLMAWGLSMTIVGAVYSQLLIRVFAR